MRLIGIDPGVNTGFAVAENGVLLDVETIKIHEAMFRIKTMVDSGYALKVRIENPNLRKWFGPEKNRRDKAQGAGSIKRDYKIWEDFLNSEKIPFEPVAPKDIPNLADGPFRAVTGWKGRTSQHAREAAILIYGRK